MTPLIAWGLIRQRFRFAPARMQNPFRVAVRLRAAHEDQVAGGPECRAVVAGRHRPIVWITGVLAVDDFGHAPERRHDLRSNAAILASYSWMRSAAWASS